MLFFCCHRNPKKPQVRFMTYNNLHVTLEETLENGTPSRPLSSRIKSVFPNSISKLK